MNPTNEAVQQIPNRPEALPFDVARGSHVAIATASKTDRIPALDFIKGALVLFMVLGHWIVYFPGNQMPLYKYLLFVPTSFLFMTGFMISKVYLSKFQITNPQLPRRLVIRGLKILGIFLILNVARSLLLPELYTGRVLFNILVPISFLLLLSALLLIACRFYRYSFHAACLSFYLCILILESRGIVIANLELLAIGSLGVICGYLPIKTINAIMRHPYILVTAYLCYIIAITIWGALYPLQVFGVGLTLMLLYIVGAKKGEPGRARGHIILLGKYSLFAYIAQIAVLQLLRTGLRHIAVGAGALGLSFFAAFALTMISVEVADRLRARAAIVDRLYRAVFS